MATQGHERSVSDPTLMCNQCGKLSGDSGATLLKCAGCGERSYCGKECQSTAWQAGHKTECRQFAAARRQQLINQRLGTGSDRIERFLLKLGTAAADGEAWTPSDLELLHAIQQTIKPLVSNDPGKLKDYLMLLTLQAWFAGGIDTRGPLDRPRAELVVKEIRWVLEEHIVLMMMALPREEYLNLVKMGMQLLQDLGRRGEAAALGVQEIPGMEALVATGSQEVRRQVARFFLNLASYVDEGTEDRGKDGEEAQGAGRNQTQRVKETWAGRVDRKDREEAEGLARRALAVAEGAGLDEKTLFPYLLRVASLLTFHFGFSEALPYARRALEVAPPEAVATTVEIYGHALIELGSYTEAEKVLRRGIAHIGVMVESDRKVLVPDLQSKLHFQMGRLLLRRGELEEALSHATQAHALILPHLDDLTPAERKSKILLLWDLCGDVSEKMGRLEEAREWDRDAVRRTGCLGVSGRRRSVQGLISQGRHKEADDLARNCLDYSLGERHYMESRILPSEEENLALAALADAFETVANGNPETLALAKNIRADVAENRAIMEALRLRLLEETREEAAAASNSRIKGASRKGKKKRSKRKKKGQGKSRTGATQREGTKEETCQGGPAGEPSLEAAEEAKEEEEAAECAICLLELEDEEDEEEVTALVCGHPFHTRCVTLWVNKCNSKATEATCPICRAVVMY